MIARATAGGVAQVPRRGDGPHAGAAGIAPWGASRQGTRLVAYHASLIEEYPPFSFDTEDGHETPLAAPSVR